MQPDWKKAVVRLEALNRALKYIDKLEDDKRIVWLGDIVGYGPNPVECLEIVESLTNKICLGNHEYAILNTDSVLYVHASPDSPMEWKYIYNAKDAYSSMAGMKCSLCFVGHSHIPGVYTNYELYRDGKKVILSSKGKTIVNVGSIGQPRDGSPLLSFAVFDDVNWDAEIVRLTYNYQETMAKIKKVGLPLFLADRLAAGV